jgi:hypothetical protein
MALGNHVYSDTFRFRGRLGAQGGYLAPGGRQKPEEEESSGRVQ